MYNVCMLDIDWLILAVFVMYFLISNEFRQFFPPPGYLHGIITI